MQVLRTLKLEVMRILSVYYKDNEISIYNTLGFEKIYYNGEKLSSKFSFTGASHEIVVIEDGEEVYYHIDISTNDWGYVCCDVWRNGKVLVIGSKNKPKPFIRSAITDAPFV